MGFLDPFGVGDGVSVVSGGISRPSASKRHRSRSRSHRDKKKRSRSRSSSRHRGYGPGASLGAGLSGFFGNDSHYHKNSRSTGSFFGLGNEKNHSRGSFFGFSTF